MVSLQTVSIRRTHLDVNFSYLGARLNVRVQSRQILKTVTLFLIVPKRIVYASASCLP